MDLDVLKILETRDSYNTYIRFIEKKTVTKETYIIIQDLKLYYLTQDKVNWLSFKSWFCMQHNSYDEDTLNMYRAVFDSLHTMSGKDSVLVLENLKLREHSSKIAEVAGLIAEGDMTKSMQDVEDAIEQYNIAIDKTSKLKSMFVTDDLDDIITHVVGTGGLNWRLPELNLSCGPIRKGDFIIVGARPDSGKTTLLASEATFMAQQLEEEQDVLWFNNEEEGRKVKARIWQAALEKETSWLYSNREDATELYKRAVGRLDRIKVVDNSRLHYRDVETILKNSNPGLIIFDQLWKVTGFGNDVDVTSITNAFNWGRDLAKEYAPVITVHQADASAHGVEYIEMNQLYMSKTGLQGEADAIITLGRDLNDPAKNLTRGLYVPKNKLAGSSTTKEEYRNGKFEIIIKPSVARFEGTYK